MKYFFFDTRVLTAKVLVLFSFLFQFYAVESILKVLLALYVDVGPSLLQNIVTPEWQYCGQELGCLTR